MNGNLVYREQDVEVEGPAALDLEVERYYNSMLPESENTEWGDGWTLAQTPDLEPIKAGGSSVPNQAEMLDSSGAIEDDVQLPTEVGAEKFDPALQATLTKKAGGGYELTDQTGESATSIAFDKAARPRRCSPRATPRSTTPMKAASLPRSRSRTRRLSTPIPAELELSQPEPISTPTYSSSFGSNGSGNGQLKSPGDVAVDCPGQPLGRRLGATTASRSSTPAANISPSSAPSVRATASSTARPRSRSIATATSWSSTPSTTESRVRLQRAVPLQIRLRRLGQRPAASGPEGIAIDATRQHLGLGHLQRADPEVQLDRQFVKVVGSKGSGTGQLGEPTGIDVDAARQRLGRRLAEQPRVGLQQRREFLSQFGSVGSGNGQFSHPDGIEIDKFRQRLGRRSEQQPHPAVRPRRPVHRPSSAHSDPVRAQFSFAYPMGMARTPKGISGSPMSTTIASSSGWCRSNADLCQLLRFQRLWQMANSNPPVTWLSDRKATSGSSTGSTTASRSSTRPANISPNTDPSAPATANSTGPPPSRWTAMATSSSPTQQQSHPEIQSGGRIHFQIWLVWHRQRPIQKSRRVVADFKGNIWVADTYNGRDAEVQ